MDINLQDDSFALVDIKSIGPEIMEFETIDLNFEIPVRNAGRGKPKD